MPDKIPIGTTSNCPLYNMSFMYVALAAVAIVKILSWNIPFVPVDVAL